MWTSYSSVSLDLNQHSNFELCVSLEKILGCDRCVNLLRSEVNHKLHYELSLKFIIFVRNFGSKAQLTLEALTEIYAFAYIIYLLFQYREYIVA
jgi:hypothetical protein